MSLGDGVNGVCASVKRLWSGVVAPELRARENVCLKEAKPPGFEDSKVLGGGEGDRLSVPSRGATDFAGDGIEVPFAFFFPAPKERRKDHSDSN